MNCQLHQPVFLMVNQLGELFNQVTNRELIIVGKRKDIFKIVIGRLLGKLDQETGFFSIITFNAI
jgi:hypothetical protein